MVSLEVCSVRPKASRDERRVEYHSDVATDPAAGGMQSDGIEERTETTTHLVDQNMEMAIRYPRSTNGAMTTLSLPSWNAWLSVFIA